MLAEAAHHSPEHEGVTIDDVGALAAFLASDAAARLTSTIVPVDAGASVMA